MNINMLALGFLAATAIGGLAWVFVYPALSGERKVAQRRASVARTTATARPTERVQRSRREQIEGSLKEIEARQQQAQKVSLATRLTQAGVQWSVQKFIVISVILGAIGFAIPLMIALIPTLTSSNYIRETVPAGGPAVSRPLELGIGKSVVIELSRDLAGVNVSDARVLTAVVRSPRSIYVTGLESGQAGVTIVDAQKQPIIVYETMVGRGLGTSLFAAVALGFAAGFGVPRWILGFLKKRREKAFLKALPDAVDVIVRGIKAGLPLFESIKVVAVDAPEPLRSEFLAIIETQAIGMPLGEACARLYERMPLPEANFFGIVIAIQQKSGGNLSEALGNLSKVLRDRKKMAEKIQAMSMEAKASAGIIGSLPPIVMLLVYMSTPDYISLLWTHPTGQLMLVGCAIWMSIGIFVMKRMINFDF